MNIFLLLVTLLFPQTIEVRVTGYGVCHPNIKYVTETIDFKEYVKGVLPNEWYSTWNEESLKAGAVAVKMYGWSMSKAYGYVWDCTWSQVYKPWTRTEASDKAVDDTWNWVLLDNKGVVRTYYNADMWGCETQPDNCMGQWESREDGLVMDWQEILLKYYDGFLVEMPGRKPWKRR